MIVSPLETVGSLKAKIQSLTEIPVDEQRLVIGNKQLDDDSAIANCDIEDLDTVDLQRRLKGGGIGRRIRSAVGAARRFFSDTSRESWERENEAAKEAFENEHSGYHRHLSDEEEQRRLRAFDERMQESWQKHELVEEVIGVITTCVIYFCSSKFELQERHQREENEREGQRLKEEEKDGNELMRSLTPTKYSSPLSESMGKAGPSGVSYKNKRQSARTPSPSQRDDKEREERRRQEEDKRAEEDTQRRDREYWEKSEKEAHERMDIRDREARQRQAEEVFNLPQFI